MKNFKDKNFLNIALKSCNHIDWEYDIKILEKKLLQNKKRLVKFYYLTDYQKKLLIVYRLKFSQKRITKILNIPLKTYYNHLKKIKGV